MIQTPNRRKRKNKKDHADDIDEENRSPFQLKCRCGVSGDGYDQDAAMAGLEAVQCGLCKIWSHVACQRNGRASNLRPNMQFHCDGCIGWVDGFSREDSEE
jgi:hypothetical protein